MCRRGIIVQPLVQGPIFYRILCIFKCVTKYMSGVIIANNVRRRSSKLNLLSVRLLSFYEENTRITSEGCRLLLPVILKTSHDGGGKRSGYGCFVYHLRYRGQAYGSGRFSSGYCLYPSSQAQFEVQSQQGLVRGSVGLFAGVVVVTTISTTLDSYYNRGTSFGCLISRFTSLGVVGCRMPN